MSEAMSGHIGVVVADGVCTVTIDRPEKKNSLTRSMYAGLADAIGMATTDDAVRVLLLTGAGDVFCAGNDINEFRAKPDPDPPSKRFYFGLAGFPKPVVAAVPGLAIGIGCTMLLHADIVHASSTARFRLPFVDLGVVPELGSSMLLPLLCGHHRAAELLLLGEFFDAATAHEIGLVNRVLDAAELWPNTMATALALARKPTGALRTTKALLRQAVPGLAAHMETERRLFAEALASPETQAIMADVLKKKA